MIQGGIPHDSVLSPVLFNNFINILHEGIKGMLIKCADDTNLEEMFIVVKTSSGFQRILINLKIVGGVSNKMVLNVRICT